MGHYASKASHKLGTCIFTLSMDNKSISSYKRPLLNIFIKFLQFVLLIIFVGTALPKRVNHAQKKIAQCTSDLIEIETKSTLKVVPM